MGKGIEDDHRAIPPTAVDFLLLLLPGAKRTAKFRATISARSLFL